MTRKRPRKARIRREPIDLEQLAAEFADLPDPDPAQIDEQEILVALQAEVQRVTSARSGQTAPTVRAVPAIEATPAPEPETEPEPESEPVVTDPFGIVGEPTPERVSPIGLPLDQVRAWLEHVQEDLRRIQSRLAHMEAEQARLQEQHHIVAELLTSSSPG